MNEIKENSKGSEDYTN